MDYIHFFATLLVIVGSLNWGTIGLFSINFVDRLVKGYSKYVYILVGAAAVYLAVDIVAQKKYVD